MKATIPLAEIYIVQLDLEGIRLDTLQENTGLEKIVVCIISPTFLSRLNPILDTLLIYPFTRQTFPSRMIPAILHGLHSSLL